MSGGSEDEWAEDEASKAEAEVKAEEVVAGSSFEGWKEGEGRG